MSIRKQFTIDANYTISEWMLVEIRAVLSEVVDSHNRRDVVHDDTRRNAEKIIKSIVDATQPNEDIQ